MQKLQLTIPQPCHENWDNMTPEGQGRFCGSCAKQVIDFSVMTDNQLIQYFANLKHENVCGRVYPDQLNRTFAIPSPARKNIWIYWQYVLAVLFFFFAKSQQTKAQTAPRTEVNPVKPTEADTRIRLGGIRKIPPTAEQKKTITIQDEDGQPLPFATIHCAASGIRLLSNESGELNFETVPSVDSVTVSATGFQTQTVLISAMEDDAIRLVRKVTSLEEVTLHGYGATTGKMVMAGGIGYTRVRKINMLSDTLQNLFMFSDNGLRVFPNPVKQGNTINLSAKFTRTGTYQVSFSDVSGRQLLQQELEAFTKNEQQQVTLPVSWTNGVYFIKVIDEKNKTISTTRFVIN